MTERTFALTALYVYLSRGCNLRCRHCWVAPGPPGEEHTGPHLAPHLFRSIIDQAKPLGLSYVKLTGGEPLLHPDIGRILDWVRAENLCLLLETNGVLLSKELSRKIAECNDAFVSVSLDGATAETHEWIRGKKGCFQAAIEGVRAVVGAGLKPQIIMTVTRRNKGEIADLVRLAENLRAGSVKFNILQSIGRGGVMYDRGESLEVEELVEIGRWVEDDLSETTDLDLLFDYPPAFRPLGRLSDPAAMDAGLCNILGILGVLADGSYALCGIGETVPELVFGRADRDPLERVWRTTPLLRELREGLPRRLTGICGRCVLVNRCLAACIARNYTFSKSLWSSYWFCEEAYQKGLFPQTRLRELDLATAGRV